MTSKDQIRIRDQRAPGWWWCQNELIDTYAALVGVYGVAVYAVLARHSRNDVVTLFMNDIAKELHCSRARVATAIRDLARLGIIERLSGKAEGVANTYLLKDMKGVHQNYTMTTRTEGCLSDSEGCVPVGEGCPPNSEGCLPAGHNKENTLKTNKTRNTGESAAALLPPNPTEDSRFKAITKAVTFRMTARERDLLSDLLTAYPWSVEAFGLPTNSARCFRRAACNLLGRDWRASGDTPSGVPLQ
jgi:hypothetical protein